MDPASGTIYFDCWFLECVHGEYQNKFGRHCIEIGGSAVYRTVNGDDRQYYSEADQRTLGARGDESQCKGAFADTVRNQTRLGGPSHVAVYGT